MRKERRTLPLADLLLNAGQLDWLPKNPRQWTQSDIDRTAASIREDTDFLEDRPLLVTPDGEGKWIVFAGNLRHEGAKAAGLKQVPCVVYYADNDADIDTVKRRAMKDNGSFGSWDFDELANSWDDLPLADWGVPVWENDAPKISPDDYGTDFELPDGERAGFRQVSFQMPDEMCETVLFATKLAHFTEEFYDLAGDDEDKNGNGFAIYLIAKSWLDGLSLTDGASYEQAKAAAEGLRQYLRDALARSGHKAVDVDKALGTAGMSGHYFGESQWMFPTRKAYEIMQGFMPLDRDYLECKKIELRYNLLRALKDGNNGKS